MQNLMKHIFFNLSNLLLKNSKVFEMIKFPKRTLLLQIVSHINIIHIYDT